MSHLIKIFVSLILISSFVACGSTPKEVDREGLRERSDQETSQVK